MRRQPGGPQVLTLVSQHVILVIGTIGLFLFIVLLTVLFAAGGDSTDSIIILGLFVFQVFDIAIAACTARLVHLLYKRTSRARCHVAPRARPLTTAPPSARS